MKIFYAIIMRIGINVVYNGFILWIWNKSYSNKSMNQTRISFAVFA